MLLRAAVADARVRVARPVVVLGRGVAAWRLRPGRWLLLGDRFGLRGRRGLVLLGGGFGLLGRGLLGRAARLRLGSAAARRSAVGCGLGLLDRRGLLARLLRRGILFRRVRTRRAAPEAAPGRLGRDVLVVRAPPRRRGADRACRSWRRSGRRCRTARRRRRTCRRRRARTRRSRCAARASAVSIACASASRPAIRWTLAPTTSRGPRPCLRPCGGSRTAARRGRAASARARGAGSGAGGAAGRGARPADAAARRRGRCRPARWDRRAGRGRRRLRCPRAPSAHAAGTGPGGAWAGRRGRRRASPEARPGWARRRTSGEASSPASRPWGSRPPARRPGPPEGPRRRRRGANA